MSDISFNLFWLYFLIELKLWTNKITVCVKSCKCCVFYVRHPECCLCPTGVPGVLEPIPVAIWAAGLTSPPLSLILNHFICSVQRTELKTGCSQSRKACRRVKSDGVAVVWVSLLSQLILSCENFTSVYVLLVSWPRVMDEFTSAVSVNSP